MANERRCSRCRARTMQIIPPGSYLSNPRRYRRRCRRNLFIRSSFIYPGRRCATTTPPPARSRRSASATARWCCTRSGAAARCRAPSSARRTGCRADHLDRGRRPRRRRASPPRAAPPLPTASAGPGVPVTLNAAAGTAVGHRRRRGDGARRAGRPGARRRWPRTRSRCPRPRSTRSLEASRAPWRRRCRRRAGLAAERLIGAGLAIPARSTAPPAASASRRRSRRWPASTWARRCRSRLAVPVHVENDANACAVAEAAGVPARAPPTSST